MIDYKNPDPTVVDFIRALGQRESSNNPNASSENSRKEGSIGRFQYMPDTFTELGNKYFGGKSLNGQPLDINDDSHQKLVAYAEVADLKQQGYRPDEIAAIHNMGLPNFLKNGGYAKELGAKEDWRGVNSKGVKFDTIDHVKAVTNYYKQYREESKAKEGQSQTPQTPTEQTPVEDTRNWLQKRFAAIKEDYNKFDSSKTGLGEGEITAPEFGLKTAANLAGVVADPITNAIGKGTEKVIEGTSASDAVKLGLGQVSPLASAAYDSIRPDIRNKIETGAKNAFGTVKNFVGNLLGKTKPITDKIPDRVKENIISPVVDLAGSVGSLELGGLGKDLAVGGARKALGAIGATDAIESKIVNQVAEQNRKALNLPSTKANKEALAGKDSAMFASERGIPLKVEKGVFDAEPATQEILSQTKPKEEVLSELLKQNGEYIDLDAYAKKAKELANTERNRASGDLAKIEADIDKHVFELKQTLAKEPEGVLMDGNKMRVRQDILNRIKGENWIKSRFDLQTTNEFRQAQRSLGESAKNIIESSNADIAIKELNSELGDYYNLLKQVTDRAGKKAAGGNIIREYFNKGIGAIIGSHAGPFGALLGATTADGIANTLSSLSNEVRYKLRQAFIAKGGNSQLFDDAIKQLEFKKAEQAARPQLPAASELGSEARPRPMGSPVPQNPIQVTTGDLPLGAGRVPEPVIPEAPQTNLVPQAPQLPAPSNPNLIQGETKLIENVADTRKRTLGTAETENATMRNPSDARKFIQKGSDYTPPTNQFKKNEIYIAKKGKGLGKNTSLKDEGTIPENSLISEAKKYKSADEFVKAKTNPSEYAMSHRPTEGVRAFDLTEKVDGEQMIPKDMYEQWYGSRGTIEDKQSIAALKSIKGKPDAEITIYRASPSKDFNYGDWVTFSKDYAKTHAEGNGGKVYSKVVRAKDVRWAMDDINEFGYFPEDYKSQLTDIWNKANKK